MPPLKKLVKALALYMKYLEVDVCLSDTRSDTDANVNTLVNFPQTTFTIPGQSFDI